MKINIEFLQTGGVPLTNDLMDTLQSAYQIYNVLGDLAGNFTILSGCDISGATISPGIVVINGDVLPFEGGLITSDVFIEETEILKTFQDQVDKVLIKKKIVKFGNGLVTYPWANFVKLDTIKQIMDKANAAATQAQVSAMQTDIDLLKLKTAPIVNGGVVFPFGLPVSDIPAGWKECLDLRGKTVYGRDPNDATFANLGNSIGSKNKTILKTNLPNAGVIIYASRSTSNGWRTASGSGQPLLNIHAGAFSNAYEYTEQRISAPMGDGTPMDVLSPGRIVNWIEPNFQ